MAKTPDNTGENRDKVNGRFLPGKSGNPAGKPKNTYSIMAIMRNRMKNPPEGLDGKTWAELLVDRILKAAVVDGDAQQIRNILQYMEGMPKQTIKIEDEDEFEEDEITRRINEALNDKKRAKKDNKKVQRRSTAT